MIGWLWLHAAVDRLAALKSRLKV